MNPEVLVPAGDLSGINSKFLPLISEVLKDGYLIGGPHVSILESELCNYLGIENVVSVASGMDALILAIKSLNLPPKSRIAVQNNAGGYSSLAVLSCGHIPVFCDSTAQDIQIDFQDLKTLKNLQGIIVTHLYGQLSDLSQLLEWARKNSVRVIEDCAQSFGASINKKFAGTFGDLGCFSFYPTKNLGGIGDGGAVVTNSDELAKSIRRLKQYGWRERYNATYRDGCNSRLDAINAVVLSAKLKEIDSANQRRREIYLKYLNADIGKVLFPNRIIDESNVVHLAVGITSDPTKLIEFFAEEGVEIGRHYPIPDSKQEGLNYVSDIRPTPTAEQICETNVTFPIYPHLNDSQVQIVSNVIRKWIENGQ